MSKRILVVSTCGTSLFTNIADNDSDLRKLAIRYANEGDLDNIPTDDREELEDLVSQAKKTLSEANWESRKQLSAEINGIRLYGASENSDIQVIHWLIATDTWLGQQGAECISDLLEAEGSTVEVKKINNLKTNDPESFREAVTELARLHTEELQGMREGGWHVVFNLTGGFKAVQGFMQALGMLYADETVYVFERTETLIRIPRLPMDLDALQIVREHQHIFRRLHAGLPVKISEVGDDKASGSLYDPIEDEVDLSVWGKALWEQARPMLFQEKLWPPVSSKLKYGSDFQKSVDEICRKTQGRLNIINERLLDLARHLEQDSYNPSRLDFKKLKGKHGIYTHECDAWSDENAKRLFGHFEGDQFVLDKLGDHL